MVLAFIFSENDIMLQITSYGTAIAILGVFFTLIIIVSFKINRIIESRHERKYNNEVRYWLEKTTFGDYFLFFIETDLNNMKFKKIDKSPVKRIKYLKKQIKKKIPKKDLRYWLIYFEMNNFDNSSKKALISLLYSFGSLSFSIKVLPIIYKYFLTTNDNNSFLAYLYCFIIIIFIIEIFFIIIFFQQQREKWTKIFIPIIKSILEDEKIKSRRTKTTNK